MKAKRVAAAAPAMKTMKAKKVAAAAPAMRAMNAMKAKRLAAQAMKAMKAKRVAAPAMKAMKAKRVAAAPPMKAMKGYEGVSRRQVCRWRLRCTCLPIHFAFGHRLTVLTGSRGASNPTFEK